MISKPSTLSKFKKFRKRLPKMKSSSSLDSSFRVLPTLLRCRFMYGLRSEDYPRYRHFCTRRLAKLRLMCHLQQTYLKKKKKETNKNKNNNQDKDKENNLPMEVLTMSKFAALIPLQTFLTYLTNNKTTTTHALKPLWILVFTMERNWAYAMDLFHQSEKLSNPQAHQKRRHAYTKLRALHGAIENLNGLLPHVSLPKRDALDLHAYMAYMRGVGYLHLHRWERALDAFSKAKFSLVRLLNHKRIDPEREMYIPTFLKESLEPYLRKCTYHYTQQLKEWESAEVSQVGRLSRPRLSILPKVLKKTMDPQSYELNVFDTTLTFYSPTLITLLRPLEECILQLQQTSTQKKIKKNIYPTVLNYVSRLQQHASAYPPAFTLFLQYVTHMVHVHQGCDQGSRPHVKPFSFSFSACRTTTVSLHHNTLTRVLTHVRYLASLHPSLTVPCHHFHQRVFAWQAWNVGMKAAYHQDWVKSHAWFQVAMHRLPTTSSSSSSPSWPMHFEFPKLSLTKDMCQRRMVWVTTFPSSSAASTFDLAHAPCASSIHPVPTSFPTFFPIPSKPWVLDLAAAYIQMPSLNLNLTVGARKRPDPFTSSPSLRPRRRGRGQGQGRRGKVEEEGGEKEKKIGLTSSYVSSCFHSFRIIIKWEHEK
ncbi:signal recognition particle subunit srp68 [Coelomomyces lativittatus]|nr:signal recognition particle subunit srp68 [Coelomomyces lativittatus]